MSKQNLEENINTVQHYIDLGWKVETEVRHTESKNDKQPIYIFPTNVIFDNWATKSII